MAAQYVVTGPLVIARTQDGGQVYIYEGRALPDNVSTEEADRLVETGLVTRVDTAPLAEARPASKAKA